MKKILVTSKVYEHSFDTLKKDYEVIIPEKDNFSNDELIERIHDCDALLSMFTVKIGRDILSAAPKLKIVSNYGVGFNNVDIAYATEHNIVVTNTPDPVTEPTAELAMGLMSALCRNIITLDNDIRIADKLRWGLMQNISSTMIGKTLGIIGFGRIGRALARRAEAACMKIVYHSRHRLDPTIEQQYHAQYLPMDELLKVSDFVSLHTPLTDQTRHLIDKEQLMMMKPTAYIINTSRGPVINEHVLAECLHEGKIAGAGIDVFEKEPAIDPLLLTAKNAILLPHVGTATRETREETAVVACNNIINFFNDEGIIFKVN